MKININFEDYATAPKESVKKCGFFSRSTSYIPTSLDAVKAKLLCDEDSHTGSRWYFLSVPVKPGDEVVLNMNDMLAFSTDSRFGLYIEKERSCYLFPASPRFIIFEEYSRVEKFESLEWCIGRQDNNTIRTTVGSSSEGIVEIIWITSNAIEELGRAELTKAHKLEEIVWSVEGCWSSLRSFSGFFDFFIRGRIYANRYCNFGRMTSAQTAYSLYKILSILYQETKIELYRVLMSEIAYSLLADLGGDGAWENGEWLKEMETHMRFQIDGVHLLISAYECFGDSAFLEGAELAASFVIKMRDELDENRWWFLHDTLELDKNPPITFFVSSLTTRAFGKKKSTTLTLNTHIAALVMLKRLSNAVGGNIYKESYDKGLEALKWVLSLKRGTIAHLFADWILKTSFSDKKAPWPWRGMRFLFRKHVVPQLYHIQRIWPCFITPRGYIYRDMALPVWACWYHLVNLHDLILLYQLNAASWLRPIIDNAFKYTLRSGIVPYLAVRHNCIVPQWLQILKAYSAINDGSYANLLEQQRKYLQDMGYGTPPEIYTDKGSFLTK